MMNLNDKLDRNTKALTAAGRTESPEERVATLPALNLARHARKCQIYHHQGPEQASLRNRLVVSPQWMFLNLDALPAQVWAESNRNPKLLELRVNDTKQTVEVVSNRDEIAPHFEAD
jgi:hypothetical protein